MYNVETYIMPDEIRAHGRERALEHARRRAWLLAVEKTNPERSIALFSATEQELPAEAPGYSYRCHYAFEIDPEPTEALEAVRRSERAAVLREHRLLLAAMLEQAGGEIRISAGQLTEIEPSRLIVEQDAIEGGYRYRLIER